MVCFKFRPDDSCWTRTLQDSKLVTSYKELIKIIILCHVFKIKSGTGTDYLGKYFSLASSVHGYSTRFRVNSNYTIPKVKGFGRNPLLLKVVCSAMIYLYIYKKNKWS